MKRICVFCGSYPGSRPLYLEAARRMGQVLAQQGLILVYGGGNVGLMGALADAALAAGGEVIGIIPESLVAREIAHRGLSELRVVRSMHERKALMIELADGFVALPGGLGTFEEFCEAVTWSQLGLHQKPCGLLNVANFYDSLLAQFDHTVAEGFTRPDQRAYILVETEPESLLARFATYQPPLPKWTTPNER